MSSTDHAPCLTGAPPRRMVDAGSRWHIGEWFKRWGYAVEWLPVGGHYLPHLNGQRTTIAVLCELWDSAWRREYATRR